MNDVLERDEWRVEVELDDEEHGYTLAERLRAHDLDDEARERLGEGVIVTRDGSRIFLYAGGEGEARAADRVMRELVDASEVTAEVSLARWHPVEEAWRPASVPLPRTDAEREEEQERKVAEARHAAEHGEFDWEVRVELESHSATAKLGDRLAQEGLPVVRRWRYLRVGALTEEAARELTGRILAEAEAPARARVEPRLSEPTHPFLVFLESR